MSTLVCMEGGGFEEDYKKCVDGSGGKFNWTEIDACAKVFSRLNSRDIYVVQANFNFPISVLIFHPQGGVAGFNTGKGEELSNIQPPSLAAACLAAA